jgi:hypothetical protein
MSIGVNDIRRKHRNEKSDQLKVRHFRHRT